ncbi:MAG: TonB-dependent receptor family protein [Methylophilaceae bacterium]
MFQPTPLTLAIAASLATFPAWAEETSADSAVITAPVVVTATRVEQNSFDLPVSIDVVDGETIREGQPRINLSETAVRIPGVVVSNRNNPAQDIAISTRGFGARSAFGVRGVRLYADGIPMSMPDGAGQTGTFNLDTAKSIEFMRGPFSALYGNSSGGVVQLLTADGEEMPTVSGGITFGSYDSQRESLTFSGQEGAFNYIVNAAHQQSDGYRDHSESTRDTLHGKFSYQASEDTKITLLATALDQPESQDPLGLTKAQMHADPRSIYPDTGGGNAESRNTHVDRNHVQAGVVLDHNFSEEHSIRLMTYYGQRENRQYLVTNTVSTIDRDFGGADARWTYKSTLADKPFTVTAGLNYDTMTDDRRAYNALNGVLIPGETRREDQNVHNFDQYVQATWEPSERWLLTGGLRHTKIDFDIDDQFLSNGDNSGSMSFSNTSPVAGVTFKLTPTVNLYANAGKGFETPTFIELNYDRTFSTINNTIKPSESKNYEVGVKAFISDMTRVNLALFKVDTEKEIVVDTSVGGQTAYKNAGDTERKGLELSVDSILPNNFKFYAAYTLMSAEYKDAFQCFGSGAVNLWCTGDKTVDAGNKIPGTYSSTTYAELSWKHAPTGFSTAIEGIHFSKTYVNDLNTESANPYTAFNWRGGFTQKMTAWEFNEFIRVDNITDKNYSASVKVNETRMRYYEPSSSRNWLFGVSASYRF